MAADAHHAPSVAATTSTDHDHATVKLAGVGASARIALAGTDPGRIVPHRPQGIGPVRLHLYLPLTEAVPLAVASILVVPAAALSGIVTVKGALEGFSAASA